MKQIIFIAIVILVFCPAPFAQTNENPCPSIELISSEITAYVIAYTVESNREIEKYNVNYNWTVKGGKILAGQNTKTLAFQRENDEVSVGVEIAGLPKYCNSTVYESFVIDPPFPRKIDEFGKITNGDKKLRIESFFNELQNNPTSKGLIVSSDDENSVKQLKFLNDYFDRVKIDKARIEFLITDETKELMQFWIIPAGSDNPDFKNSLIIEAKDFDKLYNFFRPKPTTKKAKNKNL